VVREAIRAVVLLCRDMHELEVKEVDGGDPLVDYGIRLTVRVVKHTLDKGSIHFDY
jgi:hypothetical protein